MRNRFVRGWPVGLAAIASGAVLSGTVLAGQPVVDEVSGQPPAASRAGAFRPRRDFAEAGQRAVDLQSRWILGVGFATTMAAHSVDSEARDRAKGQLGDADRLGNDILGTGVPGALLGAGIWTYGAWNSDIQSMRSGQMQLEALAATGVATILIKVSVDRTRPDASDRASFPSGHTSTTFATATVLNEIYGWRAGAPAFALAALTGLSRMSADRHWFSDVAAGATLGVWLGRAFATDANQASASAPAARNSRSLVWFEPRVEGGSAQALWDF